MKLKAVTRLTTLCIALSAAFALDTKVVTDPEENYVLSGIYPDPDQGPPEGADMIMRLDLDLSGDGRKAVFLAFSGMGGRSGSVWTAYIPRKDGGYDRVDTANGGDYLIQFRADRYYFGKFPGLAERGGLICARLGKGGCELDRYEFKDGKAELTENIRSLDYDKPEDLKLYNKLFEEDPAHSSAGYDARDNRKYLKLSAKAIRERAAARAGASPVKGSQQRAKPR